MSIDYALLFRVLLPEALLTATALLVIGVLANGGGRSDLHLNWILLVLVITHCLAQIWLGIAGCRSALRWIDWRQEKPAPFAVDGETI